MKYLVDWTYDAVVPAECPDWKPDPYTGEYPTGHCAVYHTKIERREFRRVFDTEEEVNAFTDACPDKDILFYVTELDESKLEDTP